MTLCLVARFETLSPTKTFVGSTASIEASWHKAQVMVEEKIFLS